MRVRDRLAGLSLLLLAIAAWSAVAWLVLEWSPVGQPQVQLAGAVAFCSIVPGLLISPSIACPVVRADPDGGAPATG